MTGDKSRIERIIEQINATNVKKIAFLLVIGFACYHGLIHLRYSSDSCKWLLSDGRYKGDQEWQPYGCMLHRYSKIDTRKCLRYIAFYGTNTHIVFIGDDKIRDLYVTFVNHLKPDEDDESVRIPQKIDVNLTHVDSNLKIRIEFYWAPYISKAMVDSFHYWESLNEPPSVIVVGCAFWSIQTSNGSQAMVEEYKMNLTRLVQPIDGLHEKKTKVLWALQEPVDPGKLKPEYQMITNEDIELYNKAAIEILYHSQADLWYSLRLVGQGMMSASPDGIHLPPRALKHDTQILLNMYCNDYMNFNDGSCCSSMESYTMLQIVTFVILTLCVIVYALMLLHRLVMHCRGRPVHLYSRLPTTAANSESTLTMASGAQQGSTLGGQQVSPADTCYNLFKSLAFVAIIMGYFLVCDRTNFFMKENKYYSEFSFWLPIGYVTILGLFFTEDSKYTRVLHRDQLNEWKGWMILVILVYHMTGADPILPINMHIKVLISAYLFLLGYEHFCNAWQRCGTTSSTSTLDIVLFFRTLFQLNFVTVTLCLCMNRPYQFYYFVPLMSFWYLTVYCFLVLPPHVSSTQNSATENNAAAVQYFYVVMKFIVFFACITVFFMSEVFFEKIFVTRPWKALFVTTDDDIREWWLRWKLDRYSAMYGMSFALILLISQRYNLYDDNNHNNLFSRGLALTVTTAALMAVGCYVTVVTFLCRNVAECSEIHSYVVFLPIVGYVVLRNVSGVLRTRYSAFFAWFGEISLELYICQYHIWLAADTHGVLVLVPGYPALNVLVTSFVFVCASHEIHRLTKVLLPYAVPADWKCVLRNFILFLAVLVPIGINDGMF